MMDQDFSMSCKFFVAKLPAMYLLPKLDFKLGKEEKMEYQQEKNDSPTKRKEDRAPCCGDQCHNDGTCELGFTKNQFFLQIC